HMRRGRQGPSAVPTASRPGSRRLATRVFIPRPHPGSRGTSKAPIEPESQASAESAATDASAAAGPSAGGFQDACPQVLEQMERTRIAQRRAEAALAKLVDQAVGLGIGWPEIAVRLGVSRQAARQYY